RLRSALRADEERIAALIVSILDSKSAQDAALKLEGDRAQSIVDAIQEALNRGYLMAQDRRRAHRILRKLSESSDRLPSSLFLSGVTDREEQPTFVGDFADIYRASYGSKTVALKHMRQFTQSSELHDVRLKLIDWKNLHHPYILPFMGIDRESIPASLCIVSPWMENGMILDHLNAHGRSNVDKFLSEIAQGLQYLHSCDIVHGDLRGANILINEDFSACLANFGLGVFTSTHTSTRAGSLYWMAPELIDRIVPTSASDVYAFGCVCFEVCVLTTPLISRLNVTL
ncbi:kinase-like domain-containing protein, partial [Mycena filopes]